MTILERLLLAVGGVFGLVGVGCAAAAAHITGPGRLDVAANMLLFHAPTLIALVLAARSATPRLPTLISASLIGLGTALFAGELATRAFWNITLFPMAAPTGGTLMMIGWAAFAVTALIGFRAAR